jgi:hypothetical protein
VFKNLVSAFEVERFRRTHVYSTMFCSDNIVLCIGVFIKFYFFLYKL